MQWRPKDLSLNNTTMLDERGRLMSIQKKHNVVLAHECRCIVVQLLRSCHATLISSIGHQMRFQLPRASVSFDSLFLATSQHKNIGLPTKNKAKTLAAAAKTSHVSKNIAGSAENMQPPMQHRRAHALRGTRVHVGQPRRVCRMVAHVAAGRHR